jgi:hypothetical protein
MGSSGYVSLIAKCPVSGLQVFISQFWILGVLNVIASVKAKKTESGEISEICKIDLSLCTEDRSETKEDDDIGPNSEAFIEPDKQACSFYSNEFGSQCVIDIESKGSTAELRIRIFEDFDNFFSFLKLEIVYDDKSLDDCLEIRSHLTEDRGYGWTVISRISLADPDLNVVTLRS